MAQMSWMVTQGLESHDNEGSRKTVGQHVWIDRNFSRKWKQWKQNSNGTIKMELCDIREEEFSYWVN